MENPVGGSWAPRQGHSIEVGRSDPLGMEYSSILQDLISIDPAQCPTSWPTKQKQRRYQCQELVNRYYRQIRYGCDFSTCQISTCFTYQKKHSVDPFRRPTVLSARAIATFWAGEDEPFKKLCSRLPNETEEPLDQAFRSQDALDLLDIPLRTLDDAGVGTRQTTILYPLHGTTPDITGDASLTAGDVGDELTISQDQAVEHRHVQRPTKDQSKARGMPSKSKDNKSFTQNLFDTMPLKLARELNESIGDSPMSVGPNGGNQTIEAVATSALCLLEKLSDAQSEQATKNAGRTTPVDLFSRSNLDALSKVCTRPDFMDSSFRLAKQFDRITSTTAPVRSSKNANALKVFRVQLVLCLGYVLSNPTSLSQLWLDSSSSWKLQRPEQRPVEADFRSLRDLDGHPQVIFPALWECIGQVFSPDRAFVKNSHFPESKSRLARRVDVLNNTDAAHCMKVSFAALMASLPLMARNDWVLFSSIRRSGRVILDLPETDLRQRQLMVDLMAAYDDEMAMRLVTRLILAFASRSGGTLDFDPHVSDMEEVEKNYNEFESLMIDFFATSTFSDDDHTTLPISISQKPTSPEIMLEWSRSVLFKVWTSTPEFSRSSTTGCAISFMSFLYRNRDTNGLQPKDFSIPFLTDRLDLDMPVNWISVTSPRETAHILSCPFLFTPKALVTYFRAINYSVMSKAFEASMTMSSLAVRMSSIAGQGERDSGERLKIAMATYLVLEIRRDNILTDALNQLWRRQKRELLRPLKVRMGMDEGEEGVDHGGVQQEFFRIALGQALNPDYGLFVTDQETRMSWFQPCSHEPLYKFEMLGLLSSLAIYNGLMLPVTFPTALYRKLLGLRVSSLSDIEDGWPGLARGLNALLQWSDGDVEQVFVRSYVFTAELVGTTISVDIEQYDPEDAWPPAEVDTKNMNGKGLESKKPNRGAVDDQITSSSNSPLDRNSFFPEPSMVTNANREQYVKDYIFWLTDKSIRPQYEAFARGFFACLDRKALSIFTPEALKGLVEGSQDINLDELQKVAVYENGYSSDHAVIKDFWTVVRKFNTEEVHRLLEFVTASDRIPVNGIESILFVIQRNGTSDERLPTSLTCFGRLLLPEYSGVDILEKRLRLAISNSQGFGVA